MRGRRWETRLRRRWAFRGFRRMRRSTTRCRCLRLRDFSSWGRRPARFRSIRRRCGRLVDTVTLRRGPHAIQGWCGCSVVSVECGVAAESDGVVCVYYDGDGSAGRDEQRECDCEFSAGAGGYVFDRSADEQDAAARSHLQEYFVQDDWRADGPADAEPRRAVDAAFAFDGEE